MFDFLTPIFVIGIITLGVYRVFELFVRKKERMSILEKLGGQEKLSDVDVNLNLPFFQKSSSGNWALKISLLLIGVGIGLLVGFGIEYASRAGDFSNNDWNYQRIFGMVYFASVAIFGGFGLLAAYLIEQKNNRK